MKTAGLILTIIGGIFIILFIVFAFIDRTGRGDEQVWVNTWSPILGSFLFFAGIALLVAFRKKKTRL